MNAIQLIVGLGNPGREYEATRHNAGFWFTTELLKMYQGQWQTKTGYQLASIRIGNMVVRLVQPLGFMNRSGIAVQEIAHFYQIPAEAILVAHDELDLMPGQVRLKQGGGNAGHNGLKDIQRTLGANAAFWRLRIGIGHPRDLNPHEAVASFVLHPPKNNEAHLITSALTRALALTPTLLNDSPQAVMQQLHTAVSD